MSHDCVVDASVGIKLFLIEALSDRAHVLFSRLADLPPARLYVPDLFFIECTNILWKYSWRFGYPPENARQDLADLIGLPLHVVSMAELARDALALATAHGITAYDAAYVALGQRLALPFITTDRSLVQKLAGAGLDLRYLGEITVA